MKYERFTSCRVQRSQTWEQKWVKNQKQKRFYEITDSQSDLQENFKNLEPFSVRVNPTCGPRYRSDPTFILTKSAEQPLCADCCHFYWGAAVGVCRLGGGLWVCGGGEPERSACLGGDTAGHDHPGRTEQKNPPAELIFDQFMFVKSESQRRKGLCSEILKIS